MKYDPLLLQRFVGTGVYKIILGYGSFLDLFSRDAEGNDYRIWLYLTDWAVTRGEEELCAADTFDAMGRDKADHILDEIASGNISYEEFYILDQEEFHIIFSHDIVVEIWANDYYGSGTTMAMLSYNDKVIGKVTVEDAPGGSGADAL